MTPTTISASSISILATKLFIPPPRPKGIRRSRLTERLNEGLHSKLTLISAPAGFGKTTLVSEWLADPQASQAAWLSLDEADSDVTRFLAYLVAALQTLVPNLGEKVLGALHSPQPPPTAGLLTTLLNEIATIPDNFVLVLDDYHAIDATAVDEALTFLIEHLPPQMHLVITTREDPQLPLNRLRARGQMTEVRAADLRFTASEAALFLNQMMGLKLSSEAVAALETRTEGWIAALQLAALSMRGRQDITEFVATFAGDNRYIADYLIEEVLQRQPEGVRSFLFQTSILDTLSGPLCDAVTLQSDGMVLLDFLERGNLFVVPLDDKRHWYRYHHLFADMLATLALQEQPTQVAIWHQRASGWYADNALPVNAIRHALAAKDFARAADQVERMWPTMDSRFQAATWLGWAKALPDAFIRARPVLSVAYAWAFLNAGELEAGEARLQDAEQWLYPVTAQPPLTAMVIADEAQFRLLPASIATARAYIAQTRGDLFNSVKYGRQALDLLPAEDHLRRGPAAALLALAHWASGDLEEAYQTLAAAMTNFQKVGNLNFGISGTYGLADIRTTQGRLHEAIKIYKEVLHFALAQGEPLLRGTAELYLGLSELYRGQGDADSALQHLLHSDALGEEAALPNSRHRFRRVHARFKETQGDLAGAIALLDEAERHYRRGPVPDVRPLAAFKTRVWVAQGRLSEALQWVREQGLSVDDELSFLREFEHITLARVLIANYWHNSPEASIDEASIDRPTIDRPTIDDTLRLLARLRQAAEAGARMGSVLEITVLQALAHQARADHAPPDHASPDHAHRDHAQALGALQRALKLAEAEGYVRIFVDEGLPMARLLYAALAEGVATEYIRRLLSEFTVSGFTVSGLGQTTPKNIRNAKAEQAMPIIEPLSDRELEVLTLIAEGLGNQEIAIRLYLSLHTVKVHARNIFGKLGASSRTHAVAKGRALGILPQA